MNVMYKITRLFVLLFCCFAFLTACSGYSEKYDLLSITKTLDEEGYSEEMKQSLQDRIKNAKNDNEIISVLDELSKKLDTTQQKLGNLKMRSKEGQQVRQEFVEAMDSMAKAMTKVVNANLADSSQLEKIQQEMHEAEVKLKDAKQHASQMAQKYGLRKK